LPGVWAAAAIYAFALAGFMAAKFAGGSWKHLKV
jgi:hypothetical protein